MSPRATESAVAGHMRPADLQLDHTVLNYSSITETPKLVLTNI